MDALMKAFLPGLTALVIVAFIPLSRAGDDVDIQIQQLEKQGQEFGQAAALSGSMANASADLKAMANEYREFSNNFGSFNSYVQNNDFDQAVRMLRRWLARTKNEQIKKSLATLLDALQAQRKKQIDALTKLVDEKLARVAAGMQKAVSPDDVELLRLDIEDFRSEECNTGGREIQRLSNRLSRASSFLENWRQYVAMETEGDYAQALSCLSSLRRSGGSAGLISSKDLAARYTSLLEKQLASVTSSEAASPVLKAVAGIMEKVRSGSDAGAAASQIAMIQSIAGGNDSRFLGTLQSQLDQIARMQLEFADGAYGRVLGNSDFSSSCPTPYDKACAAMRSDLKARSIAAIFKLEKLGEPKPGEGFSVFLRSAADQAFEKKDWSRLAVLLSAYSVASGGGYYGQPENPQQGVRAYLAGLQLEKAGLFRDAVRQFTNCIALTGPFVPRDEATEEIERLRKDQPQAFAPAAP